MNRIVKSLTLLLSVAFIFILAACGQSDSSSSNKKVLRVATSGNGYPDTYKENGKLTGYDIDIINAIGKKIGYKVQWTTSDFSGTFGLLESNRVDTIASGVTPSPERKKKYNFSEDTTYFPMDIVVSKSNNSIKSFDDLLTGGKTVGVTLGSTYEATLKKHDPNNKIKVKSYESGEGITNDVLNGKLDATIASPGSVAQEVKKTGVAIKTVGEPFDYETAAYPFKKTKEGDALRKKINKALDELRADGTLSKLATKYFGYDVSDKVTNKH